MPFPPFKADSVLTRLFLLQACVLAVFLSAASAQVVNVDFNLGGTPTFSGLGAAPDAAGNVKWNGLPVTGGSAPGTANATSTFTGLVHSDNTPSGLSLTVRRTNQSDLPAVGNSAADLLRDYVYVNSGNPATQLSGTITFDGLDPGVAYDLYLYGSGTQPEHKTAFTIGPTTLKTTGPSAATTDLTAGEDYVLFTGILPDVNNEIVVTYANIIDGANPGSSAPVNGCQIVATVPTLPPSLEIRKASPAEYHLAWPAEAVGYQLETSTDLFLWDVVSGEPDVVADEFIVTVPIIDSKRFFRLNLP